MYKAQEEKDKILNEIYFKNKKGGFFIDIGAHDGKSINCTYFLEKHLEWSGVCVEPLKRRYDELVVNRPRSICLNKAVYSREGFVKFRDITGYNEMLSGIEDSYDPNHEIRIIHQLGDGTMKTIEVPCITLNSILEDNNIKSVDYLKIDTEGSELDILKSLDFSLADIKCIDIENNYSTNFQGFLEEKGYKLLWKNFIDEVYIK